MEKVKEIEKRLANHKEGLKKKFKVREIGIFGSYVKGEETGDSDLDILVEFEKSPDLLEFIRLENYLSEIINVKVDLVMKSALKPRIGRHILQEVRLI